MKKKINNYKVKGRSLLQRIRDLSYVEEGSDCWIWLGNKYTDGYPQIQVEGKPMRGNRAALLSIGINIEGLLACHKCDNPLCVNPDHLFAGTQSDNIKDSWDKNRQKGNIKMNFENVLEIKSLLIKFSIRAISRQLKLSRHTIKKVRDNNLDYLERRYGTL